MSSLNNKINTAVFDNMSKFLKQIYEMDEPLTDVNDVISELKKFMFEETPTKSKAKSDKPKVPKPDLPDDLRCVALTKEKSRCKSKRQPTGAIPEYCSKHNTGAPNGRIEEFTSGRQDDVQESEVEAENESDVLQPVKEEPKPVKEKKTKSKAKKPKSDENISKENDFEES